MSKLAALCLTLLTTLPALHFNYSEESQNPPAAPEQVQQVEPAIRSRFFSAEAVEAIPKLQALHQINPGFNKILFKVDGYPKNKEIIFEIKRPLSANPTQYQQVTAFTIQDDGSYLTKDNQRVEYMVGSARGFLPGERAYFRFRTVDGSVDKEVVGTPQPAVYKDKNGNVVMRAELMSVSPTVYIVEFPTMDEGEEYDLKSTTIGATTKSKPHYSHQTPLHYSPQPAGKSQGGLARLEIKRKSGEIYTLTLPWGKSLEIYQLGAKCYPYHNEAD